MIGTQIYTTPVIDGWLSPEGVMHDVGCEGHGDFAVKRCVSQDVLYKQGWVKVSFGVWYGDGWRDRDIGVTQRQYDYIYAWHEAKGREADMNKFAVI